MHLELAAVLMRSPVFKKKSPQRIPTVIHNTFQGEVEVITIRPRKPAESDFYQPRPDETEVNRERVRDWVCLCLCVCVLCACALFNSLC